jgi:UDP:flavonoid glycosyltransferase YjiC (YdhE family)
MASVLFVTWDGGGNLPPALGIAAELTRRGDSVRFLGHEGQRKQVEAAGFDFEPFRRAKQWSSLDTAATPGEIIGAFTMFTDRNIGSDLLDSVAARPVDRIVIDCMLLGALQAAYTAGLPYLVLVHSLVAYFDRFRRWVLPPFTVPRRLKVKALWRNADVVVVTALPELDDAAEKEAGGNRLYIGPVVTVGEHHAQPTEPTVLVSLSTVNLPGQKDVLQRTLDSLSSLHLRGIVTLGPAIDASGLRVPETVEVYDYLPHERVMNRVNLVVGHGGHGTTMRALAHDLPLVLIPLHPLIDQPMVARAVERRGAAVALHKSAKPAQISEAITRVQFEPSFSAAAARLGASIRACDAAVRGAEAIRRGTAVPVAH